MPTYEVETADGVFEIELEGELPEGPEGERILQRLLQQQLRQQPALPDPTQVPTVADDAAALLRTGKQAATQILGGVRDSVQSLIDLPVQIGNVITEYVSPDAPGGPRRRLVPEVQSPQLPDTAPPQSGWEKALRFGGQALGDAAGAMLLPGVRRGVGAVAKKLRPPGHTLGKELMFEPGSVARDIAEQQLRKPKLDYEPGAPAAKGQREWHPSGVGSVPAAKTLGEVPELLKTVPSEGERNLARLFGFEAEAIPDMSQIQTLQYRNRLAGVTDYATQTEPGPLRDLLERLEAQILRYR
jgi:hypothetical protein